MFTFNLSSCRFSWAHSSKFLNSVLLWLSGLLPYFFVLMTVCKNKNSFICVDWFFHPHRCLNLERDCPARLTWLKALSIDRFLFKGARRVFQLILPILSHVAGPLRFPCHLIGLVGIENIIAISDINIHSIIFKLVHKRIRTQTRTRTLTWHWHEHWHGHRWGHGHGIGILLLFHMTL